VKGLTIGRQKLFLEELIVAFDIAGYEVRTPWQVLDAANYAVPQRRQRLILLGAKKNEKLPAYPTPRTAPADLTKTSLNLAQGPTCKDAIGDLPDVERFERLHQEDAVRTAYFRKPSRYASELRCLAPSDWHFGYRRDWDPYLLTSSIRTEHSKISRRRFAETVPGTVEPISRFFKLSQDGLSNTLRAGTDGARGAFTSPRPIHYAHPRCISVREMARLHGFPDWFRFHSTKWHGAREVGNAVPPPMARAIATQVLNALGRTPVRPKTVLSFGNAELLTMTMGQAAAHFGVPAPNGRRDRKSGTRKRKQNEIEAARLAAE
jgi:DNA (cytosine-5)-methyltransferase 1